MLSEQAQKILLRATELIGIKENWIKGSLFGQRATVNPNPFQPILSAEFDTDKYCALGAIHKATCEVHPELPLMGGFHNEDEMAVLNTVAKHLPRNSDCIWGFNDCRGTTHEQVKKLFCDTVKAEIVGENGGD